MTRKKSFLISIDTEGDNQWNWKPGSAIRTENAKYLPRFQELCEKYGFIPTYLTNYEMANDAFFVEYVGPKQVCGKCEVGMHLHAWNCPPDYALQVRSDCKPGDAPYLIEYPPDIMEEKISVMTDLLRCQFGVRPVVHRAGRWAMNDTYFTLLARYGYKIDCSFTPGINWKNAFGQSPGSHGADYSRVPFHSFYNRQGMLEVPMTVRENHFLQNNPGEGFRKWIRNHWRAFKGMGKIWLRPNGSNLQEMLWLVDLIENSKHDDYLMFMIHSSELMPGGKGNSSKEFVEKLYTDMDKLFQRIAGSFEAKDFSTYEREHAEIKR